MSFGLHYIQGFDDIQMYAHYKYFSYTTIQKSNSCADSFLQTETSLESLWSETMTELLHIH